jgi:hypothetical protein
MSLLQSAGIRWYMSTAGWAVEVQSWPIPGHDRRRHRGRSLRDASPGDGLAVTKIADRRGFAKPGRFAELYRAAYSETPNQTLHR